MDEPYVLSETLGNGTEDLIELSQESFVRDGEWEADGN